MLAHEILPNGDLRIFFYGDLQERADLQSGLLAQRSDMNAYIEPGFSGPFGSDEVMYEVFEDLLANSELEWTRPEYTGALTSAPMLAIYGADKPLKNGTNPDFVNITGHWDGQTWYSPIEKSWAYMYYELDSPQDALAERGEVIFSH